MDSNGTGYHLICGEADWCACLTEPEGTQTLASLRRRLPVGSPLEVDRDAPDWDGMRCELVLKSRLYQFDRGSGDRPPQTGDRRGAAFDRYGNLYWISDDRRGIRIRSAGSQNTSVFWNSTDVPETPPAGDFQDAEPFRPLSLDLSGLAVTRDHYLVAGILKPAGLLVFDLHGGGGPQRVEWPAPPEGEPGFAPFDMAARSDGGVWILDRKQEKPPLARLWSLDRRLNVVDLAPAASPPLPESGEAFLPVLPEGADPAGYCPPAPVIFFDSAVTVAADPPAADGLAAVEALTDQSAVVLDSADAGQVPRLSRLHRIDRYGREMEEDLSLQSLLNLVDPDAEDEFSLLAGDLVFLPGSEEEAAVRGEICCGLDSQAASDVEPEEYWGMLILASKDGNQAFRFSVKASSKGSASLILEADKAYLPMRRYGGRGLAACSVKSPARAYYDSGSDPVLWVPLAEQKRPRYVSQADVFTPLWKDPADVDSPLRDNPAEESPRHALDGGMPGCVWHRLMIDASLPPGTRIDVWSRAADTEAELAGSTWHAEPRPRRRAGGSELPFLRRPLAPATSLTGKTRSRETATWELLFQKARGRFLQLHVRLSGDGRSTPGLRAMRIYYPRFSYLENYLPAVYREDPASAGFLDRYLANFEGMYTALEDRIANVHVLFDVRTVPGEYLDWLAGWFGAVFDESWDEQRKRLFLDHAAELYSRRGTALGLVRAVRLATDPRPDERIFRESLEYRKGVRPSPVRIVESFRTRRVPAVVLGDPTVPETLSVHPEEAAAAWAPGQGASALHERYRKYIKEQYRDIEELNSKWHSNLTDITKVMFPPLAPEDDVQARDRHAFMQTAFDFPYPDVYPVDVPLYRDFLERRYGYIRLLNGAYLLNPGYGQFDEIRFPESLPEEGPALYDWIDFVSVVLPASRTAHHFTVLVPTLTGAQDERTGSLLERVRRVVELEKPAHTTFTVKEYWALFRVGEARLGYDTRVGIGSRLAPAVLNGSYLALSYLEHAHPWSVAERTVLGRDRLGRSVCAADPSCEEC
jgi:phage tail-like protein